jgi:hypothetical protein
MTTDSNDKKPGTFKKPSSPFSSDPHNNRGGKGGGHNKSGPVNKGSSKGKSVNVPKFKGGSGGDR